MGLGNQFMNIKKLFFSFLLILIIALLSAYFTILKMNQLSVNTQKMYTHPFTVSNAVASIQTNIITMHRDMKDIVLSKNSLEILKLVQEIQQEEDKALKSFGAIYQYYLGDKENIDTSYNAFKEWKQIREKVLVKIYDNKREEAIAITKGEGAKHIKDLYEKIETLKTFAFNKANHFYTSSIKDNGVDYVIGVIITTVLLSGLIILYIINSLLKINKQNNKQLYLIDQNILMARISLNKDVMEISNALCRTLQVKKEDIIHTKNEHFFTDATQFKTFENIIFSAKEFTSEVYITINNVKLWFNIEIFPELDSNFKLRSFNIILTNITDKKKIEEVAIIDSLTGLNNRNYFETIFEKEVRRAKRDKKNLSMIMLDIDFFKQYNDTYGHHDGDKALKAVAKVIDKYTNRSYDYAFRVGGEEFILLCQHQDIVELENFTQRFIQDIEKLKILHKNSKVSDFLTLSAGIVLFEDSHLLNADEMFKITDGLLYKAKKEGRNRFKSDTIK